MKRLLFFFLMCLPMMAGAQTRAVDRNCTLIGEAFAICKTDSLERDAVPCEKGTKWFITNNRIGDDNYVSFYIETPDGRKKEFNHWEKHDVCVYIIKREDGKKHYVVCDDIFNYLMLVQSGEKHLVQLLTKER